MWSYRVNNYFTAVLQEVYVFYKQLTMYGISMGTYFQFVKENLAVILGM